MTPARAIEKLLFGSGGIVTAHDMFTRKILTITTSLMRHSVEMRYPECLSTNLLLPHSLLIHFTEPLNQQHQIQSQNTVSGQHDVISLIPCDIPLLVLQSQPEI